MSRSCCAEGEGNCCWGSGGAVPPPPVGPVHSPGRGQGGESSEALKILSEIGKKAQFGYV